MAVARRSVAEETTFQFSNDLEGNYDTKLNESILDDRLDARVQHGAYTIGVTMLSHSPSSPLLDPNAYGPAVQGFRKRWIEATADNFLLRVGDSYTTFGRGIALAIFEDQSVAFDNVIDGADAQATRGPVLAEVIGGQNSLGDPQMVMKGGRVVLGLPAAWKSGLHGVWADYQAPITGLRTSGDRLYGGMVQGPLTPHLDLYGEYVMRDQRDAKGDASGAPQGHFGYANANAYLGPLQVVAEYKHVLRYDLPQVAGLVPDFCILILHQFLAG